MRKVYSILYEAQLQPGRLILQVVKANNVLEAGQCAIAEVRRTQGDQPWVVKCSTETSVEDMIPNTEISNVEISKDKNFLMKCITDNKDFQFFNFARKYMTEQEIKYCEESIK